MGLGLPKMKFPNCHIQNTPPSSNLSSKQLLTQMFTCFFRKYSHLSFYNRLSWFSSSCSVSHSQQSLLAHILSNLCSSLTWHKKFEIWTSSLPYHSLSPLFSLPPPLHLAPSVSPSVTFFCFNNINLWYLLVSSKIVFEDLVSLNFSSL